MTPDKARAVVKGVYSLAAQITNALQTLANVIMKEYPDGDFSGLTITAPPQKDNEAPKGDNAPQETQITEEQVRKLLTEKVEAGFKMQVKELLKKHGSARLSEIAQSKPEELLPLYREAEALK